MLFHIFTGIVTCLSIAGVVLNIKKKRVCFWVWAFTNGTWAIVDFYRGIPAQGALFTVYFGLAIWGLLEWKKGDEKDVESTETG